MQKIPRGRQVKIQNIFYVARRMDQAETFYRDALGLSPKFRDGDRWAQFDAGGANFALSSPDEAPDGAQGAVVVFEVDSIEDASKRIEEAGGSTGDKRDMGSHGRTLTFTDPEGNLCQLFERANAD